MQHAGSRCMRSVVRRQLHCCSQRVCMGCRLCATLCVLHASCVVQRSTPLRRHQQLCTSTESGSPGGPLCLSSACFGSFVVCPQHGVCVAPHPPPCLPPCGGGGFAVQQHVWCMHAWLAWRVGVERSCMHGLLAKHCAGVAVAPCWFSGRQLLTRG